ncbi:MAG: UDP-N-acetylmuramate dehydrogenase [Opitutaceae bacterium]|nr:UDP-N-acetylmuramate dehydrogenase [Opitutaceae bacterium]MBP9912385.1 UDP-N-acetylmuramate dehydrogenase [Opitutaceae bacterium]
MSTPVLPLLFGRAVRHIHCVGVGGMGMAPLAIYLAQTGFAVTGEDDGMTDDVQHQLRRAAVALGPVPAACELVVCSSAIAATHPAFMAAQARGRPRVRRGELLAEVTRDKKLVAVCGSHGKTTTTAMLITALRQANFPAGYVLGGLLGDETLAPACVGANDWVVAEVDESDGTIDRFAPELTVVVNLDWDHPDYYREPADLEKTFAALVARTRGAVLVSDRCARSLRLAPAAQTFGHSGNFSYSLEPEDREHMQLQLGGAFALATATVRAHGDFNAANATAALAAAQLMGAKLSPAALADYPGVRRRQTVLHAADGLTVLEDYAHHPAEIHALLTGLRGRMAGTGRLVVVFQPHRFSRTAQFKVEFAAALALADRGHLLEVYAAGEAPVAGGTAADIYAELKKNAPNAQVDYLPGGDEALFRTLSREIRPGDWVVFAGAGDIDRKARAWLAGWREETMKAERWNNFFARLTPQMGRDTQLRREEPLAPKTTLRVGGTARVYAEPANAADLQTLLREAAAEEVEVFVLGRGSNLIVPDEGVEGLVISLAHESWAVFEPRDGGRVWVGAGLRLKKLCGSAAKAGLTGFEFLEGIPGNVGGALRMNAGAMGGWMFDVVEEVQLMTLAGEVRTLPKAAMQVDYRHCAELHHAIALGALLRPAAQADAGAISRQIDVYRKKRQESQPRESSAGCIFKNPPGNSAGRLIDQSGLKGERVGGAEVSPVHANFIINRGGATGEDVLELVRRVRARVRQATGVELEPEVLLYGKKWKDVL